MRAGWGGCRRACACMREVSAPRFARRRGGTDRGVLTVARASRDLCATRRVSARRGCDSDRMGSQSRPGRRQGGRSRSWPRDPPWPGCAAGNRAFPSTPSDDRNENNIPGMLRPLSVCRYAFATFGGRSSKLRAMKTSLFERRSKSPGGLGDARLASRSDWVAGGGGRLDATRVRPSSSSVRSPCGHACVRLFLVCFPPSARLPSARDVHVCGSAARFARGARGGRV